MVIPILIAMQVARPLDAVMLKYLDKVGCSAATLAVEYQGRVIYSQGYGWLDAAHTRPTPPDAIIGIASCEKPVTAAAIRKLALDKGISLDESIMSLLNIVPNGGFKDPRVAKISIENVLEHREGWGSDPVGSLVDYPSIAMTERLPRTREILTKIAENTTLTDDPGTKSAYCNFGFDLLRYTITRLTGGRYIDYFRQVLLGNGPRLDFISQQYPEATPRNAVDNLKDGGPVAANAATLLRFMDVYWLNGKPRGKEHQVWMMYGSLDGSTAVMDWRGDGTNIVALFNGRSDQAHHDDIRKELEAVLEKH